MSTLFVWLWKAIFLYESAWLKGLTTLSTFQSLSQRHELNCISFGFYLETVKNQGSDSTIELVIIFNTILAENLCFLFFLVGHHFLLESWHTASLVCVGDHWQYNSIHCHLGVVFLVLGHNINLGTTVWAKNSWFQWGF